MDPEARMSINHMILSAFELATIPVMNHDGQKFNPITGDSTAEVRLAAQPDATTADLQLWHGCDDQCTRVVLDRQQAITIAQALIDWATGQ